MYTIGKKAAITNGLGRCLRVLLIFAGIALMIAACSKDEEELKKDPPPKETPPGDGNEGGGQDTIVSPADSLDAELILEHLSLMDATKITGEMPVVPNTPIPTDVMDTIYLTNGLPVGYRIPIRHDGMYDITGVFVGLQKGSFYYDVPVIADEAQDSTDVFYVNISDFPVADFKDFPISFPIHLMPHVNGMPIKDHIGILGIQKPNSDGPDSPSACSITLPAGTDPVPFFWGWEYTFVFDEFSNVIRKEATDLNKNKPYRTGGCCNDDGSSSSVAESASCSHYLTDTITGQVDTTKVNHRWRFLDVAQQYYFTENVGFFDDGTFKQLGFSVQTNVSLSNSDFCTNTVNYTTVDKEFPNTGTHDFSPGADYLNITYDTSTVPRKTLRSGEIIYSCNTLNLTYSIQGDGNETYVMFFRKYRRTEDGTTFEPPWEIPVTTPLGPVSSAR